MNGGVILLIALVLSAIIAGSICAMIAERKRRDALAALAARLELSFSTAEDRLIPSRYGFLRELSQGDNRYAYNVLRGSLNGHNVLAFDYHYETDSTDSKGNRSTTHHYFSFFILELPAQFPELTIVPEGFFLKLAQAFGYADIDFESAEFSKAFCVRSPDKKFAYDVCHPQMMEYLLANRDLRLEIELDALALATNRLLEPPQIESRLRELAEIRALMPEYLFTKA